MLQGANALLVRHIHNKAAQLQADYGAPPALAAASSHFARGDDCAAFATALAIAAQRAPHCERDLFAARAILQVPFVSRLESRTCPHMAKCSCIVWCSSAGEHWCSQDCLHMVAATKALCKRSVDKGSTKPLCESHCTAGQQAPP